MTTDAYERRRAQALKAANDRVDGVPSPSLLQQGLDYAMQLAEVGTPADAILADARKYADFLAGLSDRTLPEAAADSRRDPTAA